MISIFKKSPEKGDRKREVAKLVIKIISLSKNENIKERVSYLKGRHPSYAALKRELENIINDFGLYIKDRESLYKLLSLFLGCSEEIKAILYDGGNNPSSAIGKLQNFKEGMVGTLVKIDGGGNNHIE